MPYRDISTAFATAVRKAGITDFNCTTCGIFASRLVMAGMALTTVKGLI
jgi:hypothetical protein